MHRKRARGGFWKSLSVELSPDSGDDWLAFAFSRRPWAGVARDGRGRLKSQNWKNVYLSPYVEEPLKSKVINSFVPEQRIRKCFSCFEIAMFYVIYIWTFHVRFTHSYLAMVHKFLGLFLFSLIFALCTAEKLKSTFWQVLLFLLIISRSVLLVGILWSSFSSESLRILCLVLQNGLWFVHIPFGSMIKFHIFAQNISEQNMETERS